MLQFMSKRQNMIAKGMIGHDRERAAARNSHNKAQAHVIALAQARANRSDPFCYNRVMSNLLNGNTLLGDYSVEWARKQAVSSLAALKAHPKATVEPVITTTIPINRKLPAYC
jgi:hypothetical protein